MGRTAVLFLVCAVLGAGPAGALDEVVSRSSLPPGTGAYVEGTLAEARGEYRRAVELYEAAMEADPSSAEIRIALASLLVNLGLAERALEVLEPVPGERLDWYGLRAKGLALERLSSSNPLVLPRAEKVLRRVLEERSTDPNLVLALARVLDREGKLGEAERQVRLLRDNRGANLQLMLYHADLLRRLGRREEAAAIYRRCSAGGPSATVCRRELVDLLEEMGRPGEAADALASWLDPDDLDLMLEAANLYLDGGRPGKALSLVHRALAVDPDSPRTRRLEAMVLAALGRYDEAAARLRQLWRKDRGDTMVGLSLAWVQARAGRFDEARATLDEVWRRVRDRRDSPGAVRCALTAARVELLAGNPRAARRWVEEIPSPEQGGSELVRILAESYRRTGEWEAGVGAMLRLQPALTDRAREEARAFEAEFRLRQGEEDAVSLLDPLLASRDVGTVRLAVNVLQAVERWEDAVRATGRALERFPDDPDLLFARGAALERLGRTAESEATFRHLLEVDPDNADAANYLGYMWADAGTHLEEALRLIGRAVELRPGSGAFLDSLGWVYFRMGRLEEAENWLRRAVRAGETSGTVLAHLGEVLAARGEAEEAKRYLERALELGCDDPEHVRELLDRLEEAR